MAPLSNRLRTFRHGVGGTDGAFTLLLRELKAEPCHVVWWPPAEGPDGGVSCGAEGTAMGGVCGGAEGACGCAAIT